MEPKPGQDHFGNSYLQYLNTVLSFSQIHKVSRVFKSHHPQAEYLGMMENTLGFCV